MRRLRGDRAFTLLEVVLAIGLTAIVLFLIATAIELFLYRVDSSRTQVESSQLARTLLDAIAADLAATRYESTSSGLSQSGSAASTASATAANDETGPSDLPPPSSGKVMNLASSAGLYGNETELRIDRRGTTPFVLETVERDLDERELTLAELPHSVRYYFDGDQRQTAAEHAGVGVQAETNQRHAGLYRHRAETSTILQRAESSDQPFNGVETTPELLAPEVVGIEFAYFDGSELLTSWESKTSGHLPVGVEIRLRMLSQPDDGDQAKRRYDERNTYDPRDVVEYRRFVHMPPLRAPYEAAMFQSGNNNPQSGFMATPGAGPATSGGTGGDDDNS